jgi:hypothetical protein
MGNRTQTSLWIENDLYFLVKNNDLNLTKWVNDNLRRYFSVSSVEEVKKKIQDKKNEVLILEEKLLNLKKEGKAATKEEAVEEETWKKLKELYKERRDHVNSFRANAAWISGPNNKERCRILQLPPEDVLEKLEEWYFDKKEGNE